MITNNEFKINNVWLAIENIAPARTPAKPPAKFLPSCHKSPAKQLLAGGLAGPPATPYHGGSPGSNMGFFFKQMLQFLSFYELLVTYIAFFLKIYIHIA